MGIGEKIAALRRAMGTKQDEVGAALGVSAQAVSKWETGGTPDVELLPMIADYFGVTIDELFGRDSSEKLDTSALISAHIAKKPQEERFDEAFRLAWAIEMGIAGNAARSDAQELHGAPPDGESNSCMLFDEGFTQMKLTRGKRYFYLSPCAATKLPDDAERADLHDFFALFADTKALDALLYLYSHDAKKRFTSELFTKKLGMDEPAAASFIAALKRYSLLTHDALELNGEVVEIYGFNPNPAFAPFLTFARELIKRHGSFNYYYGNRTAPYLA